MLHLVRDESTGRARAVVIGRTNVDASGRILQMELMQLCLFSSRQVQIRPV